MFNVRARRWQVSGDLAYHVGEWTAMFGRRRTKGKHLLVFRRERRGQWRVVADMMSRNHGDSKDH